MSNPLNSEACSPPGSSLHGILQARILKWIPLSSPWYLPNPGVKPRSPAWKAVYLLSKPPGKPSLSYTESRPTCSGLQGSYNLTSTSWSELICPLFSMMHSAFATWAFFLSLLQTLRAPVLPELYTQSSLYQEFLGTLFHSSIVFLLKYYFLRMALSAHFIKNFTPIIFYQCIPLWISI